jgi:hypothetical protein
MPDLQTLKKCTKAMKPQEKAYEIWQKMMNADLLVDSISAKQCALVAVDEVLNVIDNFEMIYWEQVKQEIEKL